MCSVATRSGAIVISGGFGYQPWGASARTQRIEEDRRGGGDIQGLHPAAAGDRHDRVAQRQCRRVDPAFLVAEDQRHRAVARQLAERNAVSGGGADDAIEALQRRQYGRQRRPVEDDAVERALGDAIARRRGQRLVGPVGQDDARDPKIGRAADDGAEIMRVADAVEDEERPSVAGPAGGEPRIERR